MRGTAGVTEWLEDRGMEILREVGIQAPPVDAVVVARALGVEVVQNRQQSERGRLVATGGRATIVVRPEPRPERSQWTIAHEIGEFLLPQWADQLPPDYSPLDASMREWLANRFASLLLAPRDWFRADARRTDHDLFALKECSATASYEVLAFRTLETDAPAIVSLFDNDHLVRRMSNLPSRPPRLLDLENHCRREASRTKTTTEQANDEVRVRAWPIHEEGWRREILRTEPLAFNEW